MLRHPKYLYGPDETGLISTRFNLGDFMLRNLIKHENKFAIINGKTGEMLTFYEIVQASMNIAVSLTHIGVKKGEVVGICSETRLENWCAVIGIACTGAVMTPISIAYIKDELRHVMDISKPKYLLCSMQAYNTHKAVFKSLDYVKKIILYGDERLDNNLLYNDLAMVTTNSVLKRNVKIEQFEGVEVEASDKAFILYSSGTTGLPKGVMLSHLNILAAIILPRLVDPEFTVLNITPWYHGLGLTTGLISLYNGVKVVFIPRFEIDLYLRLIEKYKVNQLMLVPPVILSIIKTPFSYDVSSVQVILSGAAVLKKETIDAVKNKFKNLTHVNQNYGMTETLIVTLDSFVKGEGCKPGSNGTVVGNTVIKIVDIETRKALGPNQNGEVCVKGPTIMKGYVAKDKCDDFDDEAFYKTGDIGYYDDDKQIFIVDRLKELIKYKGHQVPPAEIETVLLLHKGVRDVAVVGVPNEMAGEIPLAYVVPQAGMDIQEAELQEFVAERLSNPKHLRGGVQFIDAIPRNASGKILRRRLREMLIEKR